MGQLGFYEILSISQSATEAEIKRAYKKAALKYHPDKNPSSADLFREIGRAYEVLCDPKKRKVYDQYGEFGLQIYQTYGNNVVGDFFMDMMRLGALFGVASWILTLIMAQMVVMGLKACDVISMPWIICCIPLWILFISLCICLVVYHWFIMDSSTGSSSNASSAAASRTSSGDSVHSRNSQFEDDILKSSPSGDNNNASNGAENPSGAGKAPSGLVSAFILIKRMVKFVLVFSVFVLFFMRLDSTMVKIDWIFMWIPIIVLELISLVENLLEMHRVLSIYDEMIQETEDEQSLGTRLFTYYELFKYSFFRILLYILINFKMLIGFNGKSSSVQIPWLVTLVPIFVASLLIPLVDLWWDHAQSQYFECEEEKATAKILFRTKAISYAIAIVFIDSTLGMLGSYLDFQAPNMFLVLIPPFIIIGLLLLMSSVVLPSAIMVLRSASSAATLDENGNVTSDFDLPMGVGSIVKRLKLYKPRLAIEWHEASRSVPGAVSAAARRARKQAKQPSRTTKKVSPSQNPVVNCNNASSSSNRSNSQRPRRHH